MRTGPAVRQRHAEIETEERLAGAARRVDAQPDAHARRQIPKVDALVRLPHVAGVEEHHGPERHQMEQVVDEEEPILQVEDEALVTDELAGIEAAQTVEVAEEQLRAAIEVPSQVGLHARYQRLFEDQIPA